MANISSFKMAAGIFGMAALVKITVLAIALAMLGVASSAQAGSLGKPCTAAPQSQWLSLQALRTKVEARGEMFAFDQGGNRVELFVDPTNAPIAGRL